MDRIQSKWERNDYDPSRVEESLRVLCHLEIRGSAPVLTPRYGDAMELSEWGIAMGGSVVKAEPEGFNIISSQGRLRSVWTLSRKKPGTILVEDWTAVDTDRDHMAIHFDEDILASTWFMWLRKYASKKATGVSARPQTCQVSVTRTVYSWWQKTPHSIQRRRSKHAQWQNLLSGYAQNSRRHKTYFTYVRNDIAAFVSVRRSGDTLVEERFSRADKKEPAITLRYDFKTFRETVGWYNAWEEIATKQKGKGVPVRLIRLHAHYGVLLQVSHRRPVVNSALWPEIPLKNFGIQGSTPPISRNPGNSFTVGSGTSQWTWERKGTQLAIYTTHASIHDCFQYHQLNFRDSKSCKDWFSYLENYTSGELPLFSSLAEHPPPTSVTFTDEATRWMQQEKEHGQIQTRAATAESWTNMFGECKNYELNESYLAITDTSNRFLPHIRISRSGCDLIQKRMTSVNNTQEIPLITTCKFPTADDANNWYKAWKANIKRNLL